MLTSLCNGTVVVVSARKTANHIFCKCSNYSCHFSEDSILITCVLVLFGKRPQFKLTPLFICLVSSSVSQSNSSLKKHRSRSIFSPFFCCFRNYNDYQVDPPASNNKSLSLPPPPEENGSPPKVKLQLNIFIQVFHCSMESRHPQLTRLKGFYVIGQSSQLAKVMLTFASFSGEN